MTGCRGALPLLVLAVAVAVPAAAQLHGKDIKIGIGGPLTTTSAGFGVEMKQAVELAVDERNDAGGVAGASGVAIATGKIYADCGLPVITPMASNPLVTESGFATVFRLTNRDDRKGPGLAHYLIQKMGKRRALVVDDGTPYGVGLADQFVAGFSREGTVVARKSVKVGDRDFADFVKSWPKDFDVLFFAGIREGALILREMRAQGLAQLFTCGDGCWDTRAFIQAAEGAATKAEGVRILSAAPALGTVPGSSEFGASYTAKYGPINNYAASSYDSARVLMVAIAEAARDKQGI